MEARDPNTVCVRKTKCSRPPLLVEPDPLPPLFPAVQSGKYALGREIACGGMGRVLQAHDTVVDRPVAIKELTFADSPLLAARFRREVRVTAKLDHLNIIPVYDAGTWADGTPFYVMRLVRGTTLEVALAGDSTLSDRLALLPSVIAATSAIAYAHSRGVIHRDLKPANILLGEHGETVVIDWGLAKELGQPERLEDDPRLLALGSATLTASGQVMGTASYMPIEQATGNPVDTRADVYALGAMLYHLVTGRAPYQGMPSTILTQVRMGPPQALAAVGGAPAELVAVVNKAMARDADERYANGGELLAALRAYQARSEASPPRRRGALTRLLGSR